MIHSVNTNTSMITGARVCMLGLVVLGSVLGGCRGDRSDAPPRQFFPDLDDQPKVKPQSGTQFFEDGKSQRLPVDGTVAFGAESLIPDSDDQWAHDYAKDRADKLKDDETYYFGLVAGSTGSETPQYVERMPVEVNRALIERGQERYNIYCSMCHGFDALGNDSGTVGRLMNVRPINLLDAKYRDRAGEFGSDGYLFHIIREGLWSPDGSNRMPAYGHAVDQQDAWAIVAYIRTLQTAFDAKGRRIGQTSPVDQTAEEPVLATTNDGGEG